MIDDLFLLRAALGHPPNPAYAAAVDRIEEHFEAMQAERDDDDRPHLYPRRELWARVRKAEEQLEAAQAAIKLYWISVGEVEWWDTPQREQIRAVLRTSIPASEPEAS